jgi:putative two-component system response regulator
MKHLLIIDDDHFVAKIFSQNFKSASYEVSTANSGIDAIQMLRNIKPDVIILDLLLPDMSGVDVLKSIRSNLETQLIPVIVISNSYCFSGIAQAAWSAGATKFINKEECEIKELITLIDQMLEPIEAPQQKKDSPKENTSSTILIADDDLVIHGVLEFFLKQAGFHVQSAFDGYQALEMIAFSPPDFIIIDGLMPQLDGFNLVEKINHNPSFAHIPKIMMTTVENESLKNQMMQQGVLEYLVKPFNLNHLVKLVEKHITKSLTEV